MKILAIETSCDETSASVVESTPDKKGVTILSNVVASSMALHSKTGGIIPEVAAREQLSYIIPVIKEALEKVGMNFDKKNAPAIDAIAVTYGPGLIGSLLVGVETAKTLAFLWNKPLIPVNHLFGHIFANFIRENPASEENINFPLIALIVSGGHTDLLFMKSHTDISWLGGTRDDAAGECFDKTGRLLGLPYPAGPFIEERAKLGNSKTYHFPRPLMHDKSYDFSFSGLKTAVLREVQKIKIMDEQTIHNLCRGLQDAICDILVSKTIQAAKEYNVASILLSGGVAANSTLYQDFESVAASSKLSIKIFVPKKSLCTDNAAMIGTAAFFQNKIVPWNNVAANPELYFD